LILFTISGSIHLLLPAVVLDELMSFNSSLTPAGSYLGEYYQIMIMI